MGVQLSLVTPELCQWDQDTDHWHEEWADAEWRLRRLLTLLTQTSSHWALLVTGHSLTHLSPNNNNNNIAHQHYHNNIEHSDINYAGTQQIGEHDDDDDDNDDDDDVLVVQPRQMMGSCGVVEDGAGLVVPWAESAGDMSWDAELGCTSHSAWFSGPGHCSTVTCDSTSTTTTET